MFADQQSDHHLFNYALVDTEGLWCFYYIPFMSDWKIAHFPTARSVYMLPSNRLTEPVRKAWHNGRQGYLFFLWLQSPSDYLTFHKDGNESKDRQINSIFCSVILKSYHLIQCEDHKTSNQAASYCGCLTIVSIHPLLPCTGINSFTLSCCETKKTTDERMRT